MSYTDGGCGPAHHLYDLTDPEYSDLEPVFRWLAFCLLTVQPLMISADNCLSQLRIYLTPNEHHPTHC
jgi:hypothetical protein